MKPLFLNSESSWFNADICNRQRVLSGTVEPQRKNASLSLRSVRRSINKFLKKITCKERKRDASQVKRSREGSSGRGITKQSHEESLR